MFKAILIKLAKFIGITALLIGIVLLLRHFNTNQGAAVSFNKTEQDEKLNVVKTESLEEIKGTGLQKVQENENLALYVNLSDGNIEVHNKSNGYIWRSRPTSAEMAKEKANDLWRGNMESPVFIEYVDNVRKANTTIGNVKNQNAQIKVLKLPEGARVVIDYKTPKIKLGYDLNMNKNGLEVNVPYYLIEEYGNNKLTSYSLLPFFGAVGNDRIEDGYLLVPDGSGGLIKFHENRVFNYEYVGNVYSDNRTLASSDSIPKDWVYYPVFGVKNGSNSLLAVIDEGESSAEIYGVPANIKTGFNTAYARFIHRYLYRVNTDLAGGGYLRFTDKGNVESRKLCYYFQKDDKANYVGMAEAYRSYLTEKYGMQRKKVAAGDLPLQLTMLGGDMQYNLFGASFVKTTSFEEAKSIVDGFYQSDVKSMDIVFDGWGKLGAGARYPERFPAESKLGGDTGLTEFVKYAHKFGYKVYLSDNNAEASSTKGISKRMESVYNIHRVPMTKGKKDEVFNVNAATVGRIIGNNLPTYKEYGIDGIEEKKLATTLSMDFNPYNSYTRAQQMELYAKYFDQIKRGLGNIRVRHASSYCLANISTITNMPDSYNYFAVIDEAIPFYHIAVHGLVDYVTKPYNFFDEPSKEVLKAIEYGTNVSFLVTRESPIVLQRTNSRGLNSTEYSLLRNEIMYQYNRINKALSGVQDKFITRHETIGKDVKRVTYDNGREIVINYSDAPVQYKGSTIRTMDFGVFEGDGKK